MKWIAGAFGLLIVTIMVLATLRVDCFVFRWSKTIPAGDAVAHFVLIGTFALLVNLARRTRRVDLWGVRMTSASIALLAAVTLEECSQHWIASRSFSFSDLAANWAGIVVLGELAPRVLRQLRLRTQTAPGRAGG